MKFRAVAKPPQAKLVAGILQIACLLCCLPRAHAQTTGLIEGIVFDPSGRVITGASVRIVETGTAAARLVRSDENGRYIALHLPPGAYDIEVSHPGFAAETYRSIDLPGGGALRLNFNLKLGASRERMVVDGDVSPLRPTAAEWGGLVERRKLESLPLNGRDLFDLAAMEPGAVISANAERTLSSPGIQLSAGGARPNQNAFRLDGIHINTAAAGAPASAAGTLLGLETVRELRVVSSPFSAEYGRAAGAILAAVSKSGSNEYHGSLFEFFRNSALDAKNFFDPAEGKTPPFRRNQFGGSVSGPIRRDRTFFLASYEAIRESRSETASTAVPSLAARQGVLPDGRVLQVAPQVRPYLELFPAPNGADFGNGSAEFISLMNEATREDYWAAKADHIVSKKLRIAGRYTFDDGYRESPEQLRIWRYQTKSRYQFIHTEAHLLASPSTIHAFRGGFSRVLSGETSRTRSDIPASLSFVPGRPLGTMQITGLTTVGFNEALLRPRHFIINDYQFSYDAAHSRGRHLMRLGASYNRVQFNQLASRGFVGHYLFTSLESFLLGRPASGEVMLPGSDGARGWRYHLFNTFFQDDFRAAHNLTLSFGFRWEPYTTPGEVNGKVATLRDPLRDLQTTVGGPVFTNPSRANVAPRAAVVWDPTGGGRMVIRMGGGIFFDLLGSRELAIAGARMPPFFSRVIVRNPSFPNLLEAALRISPIVHSPDSLDYHQRQAYVGRWELVIERQVARETVARIGYVGSRGINLSGQLGDVNPPRPEVLPGGRLFFPENAPRLNPAFGLIGMRRSQFYSSYHALTAGLRGRLGSVHFQSSYTWSKSIDQTSSTVFSEFLNSDLLPTMFDYRLNRGPSDFDLRHVFSGNLSWVLRGGWEAHSVVQAQSGPRFSPWIGFDRARLRSGAIELGQRPDLAAAPGAKIVLGDPARWFDPAAFSLPPAGSYGNLGRNTIPGPGLFIVNVALHKTLWRREARSLRLRVEGFNAANRPNFQLPSGLELFDSSLARLATAGRITETSTPSRQIQLALKFAF